VAKEWTEDNAFTETWNALTHAGGFLLSLPAVIAMLWLADHRNPELTWVCLAYGASLSAVYLFSTLSHAVRNPRVRHRMRSLDQGVIFLLIAGTYAPFIYAFTEGIPRVAIMIAVWVLAGLGFYSKVIARHRVDAMVPTFYLLLGWGPAMILFPYVSWGCLAMMAIGGLLYSVGTIFLHNDHRSWYYHPIWHLLVILASACHYLAILFFVVL
jgi:hemolysin III